MRDQLAAEVLGEEEDEHEGEHAAVADQDEEAKQGGDDVGQAEEGPQS